MNAAAQSVPPTLFRDWPDARAHGLVLSYVLLGWPGSFAVMASHSVVLDILGVLLCTHTMVLAAYLVHDAAHQTLFISRRANQWVGEAMNCIASSGCASFERIRHIHIRHHLDRADLVCFDFKDLLRSRPLARRVLQALEWLYIPAVEVLMHLQVVVRPIFVPAQRRHLLRVLFMLAVRLALFMLLARWSVRAAFLYGLAVLLELHVLNFFDGFHHTFEQLVIKPEEPVSIAGRDRAYELDNTYSNLISVRFPWLNALTLNFNYHNAHHQRPSLPWWRLPALHRELYGQASVCVLPLRELLMTWHRNRVRRVCADDYGAVGSGPDRAASFVGTHGVSFLTVI
ncbi:MAG: fatty acid desaturase [Steroidobacteraceae bacterium]